MFADTQPWLPLETIQQGSTFKRRVVLSPSIHLEETRKVEGRLIDGAQYRPEDKQKPEWKRLGRERYAHSSRHLCTQTTTPPPFVIPTRNDPPDQPHFFANQQLDWDFWEKHRDLVFQGAGIHPADPAWKRVHALAEDIWNFRFIIQKPGGNDFSREVPWSSPTATLIYGSWCAGCGPALVALCATIGVPARMVSVVDHMMVEAWLEDRWCLIDNATHLAKAGGNMMLKASLAEVLLNPTSDAWNFIDEQKGKYWEKPFMTYHSSGGLFHEETAVTHLTPQNALALYPGWTQPQFKSHRPRTYDLVWGKPSRTDPCLYLKQGQAFRRHFWLGSLADTETITVIFSGDTVKDASRPGHHVPEGGGTWFIQVNEHRLPLSELGGWNFHKSDPQCPDGWEKSAWVQTFSIPLELLREEDWNQVVIGSTGSGAEFLKFGGSIDWILPEENAFCPRVQLPV
jgi:hypothetical protein